MTTAQIPHAAAGTTRLAQPGQIPSKRPYSPEPINAFQRLGFVALLFYLIQLISRITEIIDNQQRFHLVLIVAGFSTAFTLLGLTFRRAFDNKIGIALALFTGWLIFELPFSSWKGGSFRGLTDTWLKSYLTYIIVVALIASLKQLRMVFDVVALATVIIVGTALRYGVQSQADERLSVGSGTLGNSNDLAMELLIGLPFLIYIVASKRRSPFLRLCALIPIPVALVIVLKTGSRAGVLAIAAMLLVLFFRSAAPKKALILILACGLGAGSIFVLPKDLKDRYATILTGSDLTKTTSAIRRSAAESEISRVDLMKHALILTARNPLFGVGIDQFAQNAANLSVEEGKPAMWHTVHCFLLLVSSETGIPGTIFYCAALWFTISAIVKVIRAARWKPELAFARELALPMLYSMSGFITFMFFSPCSYLYQVPMMCGFATALYAAVRKQIEPARKQMPSFIQPSKFAPPAVANGVR